MNLTLRAVTLIGGIFLVLWMISPREAEFTRLPVDGTREALDQMTLGINSILNYANGKVATRSVEGDLEARYYITRILQVNHPVAFEQVMDNLPPADRTIIQELQKQPQKQ